MHSVQGYIDPPVPEGTEASVFAVFDANKKLQYVGFSRDLRNSLRTVFGRRPDKVFYHKCGMPRTRRLITIAAVVCLVKAGMPKACAGQCSSCSL